MNRFLRNLSILIGIMAFLGCATDNVTVSKQKAKNPAPPPPPVQTSKVEEKPKTISEPEPKKPEYINHRIRAGETLGAISQWYSGTTKLWSVLVKENPQINPANLKIGQIVKVPLSMATVHHEQPGTPIKPAQENSEEIFGPR